MEDNIKFVDSFSDPTITPIFQRMYHRRKGAIEAMEMYVDQSMKSLRDKEIYFTVSSAIDMMKVKDSRGTLKPCGRDDISKFLDQKVREPRRLLFFKGCIFEATVNTENYSQSQLMLMTDVPSPKDIEKKVPLKLWAAPTRGGEITERYMANLGTAPTAEELRENKWTEVMVHMTDAEDRLQTRNHITACRYQYTLKHIGSSTVNKQMGNTLTVPSAIEVRCLVELS